MHWTVCYLFLEPQAYCRWETFNATCGKNEVILMMMAEYGRMKQGRCITSKYSLGCFADVLLQLDQRCSGRQHCSIGIPDPKLHEIQPCSKDMLAYLSASYICIPGTFHPAQWKLKKRLYVCFNMVKVSCEINHHHVVSPDILLQINPVIVSLSKVRHIIMSG